MIAILLPAFFVCPAIEAGTVSADLFSRKQEVIDTDCVVTAKELLAKGDRIDDHLLVDVRSAEAFNKMHIPGSINIAPHFIKDKPYLISSPVVLVDKGLSYHRLHPACKKLREKGFTVRILEGGLSAWRAHSGDLVYSSVRQAHLGSVSPATFIKEKNYHTRIVCDVSVTRSQASMKLMPHAVHLPLEGSETKQMEMIERFQRSHCRHGSKTIIVVNRDGQDYRKVKSLFVRAGCATVFYLEGGLDAYAIYLERLQHSWLKPEDRRVSEDVCRNCSERSKNE